MVISAAICCSTFLNAQIAPVNSRTTVRPSCSSLFSTWPEKISLTLLLRDLSVQNGSVFLRMHVDGARISLTTTPAFLQRFQLDGGVPLQLGEEHLSVFFKIENISFSGISASDFIRNGMKLPEDTYKVWFEVYEWNSKLKVSAAEMFATIQLFDIDPPILNFPANRSVVFAETPQNILFSWTPRHLHAQKEGFRGVYDFELVQIPEHYNGDLQILFSTTQKSVKKMLFHSQFLHNDFSEELIPNNRYAFRVRVYDQEENHESFQLKNNGYSEIFTFSYLEKCKKPENLQAVVETPFRATVSWTSTDFENRYLILYRKTGNGDFAWFTKTEDFAHVDLPDLVPNQTYELKVQTLCRFNQSEESDVILISTPRAADSVIRCGEKIISADTCKEPLETLTLQDVFTTQGTTIHLREVSGNHGLFSGAGYVSIPAFQSAKVHVIFKNIRINACFQHTKGTIKAAEKN